MPRPSNDDLHDTRLRCTPYEVHYDFEKRHGVLIMGQRNCSDMTGCINLFRGIDPKVKFIQTYADKELDTGYIRRDNGKWSAMPPQFPGQMTEPQDIPRQ